MMPFRFNRLPHKSYPYKLIFIDYSIKTIKLQIITYLQILPFREAQRSTAFAEVNAKKYRLKIKYILT